MSMKDLPELLIHAILAIFGVSARELRYKDEKKLKMARLISNAIVSTFGATIVYFISSMSNFPPQMGYITAGLVGWGGPQIIDRLFEKNAKMVEGERQFAEDGAKATGTPAEDNPHEETGDEPGGDP